MVLTGIRPNGAEAAGSGLGLSIVHAIAAAHGGYARLDSAPGAGTSVRLWIPFRGLGPPTAGDEHSVN